MTDECRTRIEISKKALIHNLGQIKKLCPGSNLGVVVKSNAYGHGAEIVASVMQEMPDVDCLFVAGIREGLALRAAGISKPVLALAYYDAPLAEAILGNIELTVYEADPVLIKELDAVARDCGAQVRVHLKVDTGLARLGVRPDEVMGCIELLARYAPRIECVGIFTHLADANSADPTYTCEQLDRFNAVLRAVRARAVHIPVWHALSSGGLAQVFLLGAHKKDYVYTTVRAGTSVYGLWKSDVQKNAVQACDPSIELKQVLTWKARILSVIFVPAGRSIGYARTYVTPRDAAVALISIGYADGYPRSLSGNAYVMIGSAYAPVVGTVSMNITAVDVTGIADAVAGADATLIGDASGITADAVAAYAGIYHNELLARLNPLIERHLVE